ncbi:beta-galactosidase [Xylariaceae sp. FL0804]|nr:beta-galactosidase [Xylariaceae sp. FL0804]
MADQELPDYTNLEVLHRNRLPPRAYWLPDHNVLLNGVWDFNYASSPLEAPEIDRLALPSVEWTKIDVPGHWQLQGHGKPHYTNTIYPFPVNPPYVPTNPNPTGTYRRRFFVPEHWGPSQLRLRFEGVDSAFHVYVNGHAVGYSQGSRNPAEFDVSDVVDVLGENELVVQVYQWCDGSYIEDQDQWWLSGIFRDVHLLAFPAGTRMEDFYVQTDLDEKYEDATLKVAVTLSEPAGGSLSLVLKDGADTIADEKKSITADVSTVDFEVPISKPNKWTAETPYLYTLTLGLWAPDPDATDPAQVITHRVGFRQVEIKDGVITVNGAAVLFRGANRHDHHPRHGRAVPAAFARADLVLMKRHNVNALRCAHYPPPPSLLCACDELGLWVMDEADLECHGFLDAVQRAIDVPAADDYEAQKGYAFPLAATFSTDRPEWEAAYVERAAALAARDRSRTCVVLWSLGNEAFYGANTRAMAATVRAADPSGRPVHYEGDVRAETADMYSHMYPTLERLRRWVETEGVIAAEGDGGTWEKPVVLCEYGHAMGNGPGGLDDYQDLFRRYRRLQGGWIWEWANHGLWKEGEEGKGGFYGYGGDFGDEPNDGTFVMDGLCDSEHRPTPGLLELKKVFQPVRFELEDGAVWITNEYDFAGLEHLSATYTVESYGESTELLASGSLELPPVKPWARAQLRLPFALAQYRDAEETETFLTVSLGLRSATAWAGPGHEVAWWQQKLSRGPVVLLAPPTPAPAAGLAPTIEDARAECTVRGPGWSVTFGKTHGCITSWVVHGVQLLEVDARTRAAITHSFWRAPTDNDMSESVPHWKKHGVDAMTTQLRSFSAHQLSSTSTDSSSFSSSSGDVVVTTRSYLAPPIASWGYHATTTYRLSTSGGALNIRVKLVPNASSSSGTTTPAAAAAAAAAGTPIITPPDHIPRVGLQLRLPATLDRVSWLGRGPGESYPDKASSQRVGVWPEPGGDGNGDRAVGVAVADLQTPYDVPQENGNRSDSRWVRVVAATGGSGHGIRAQKKKQTSGGVDEGETFDWTATRHAPATLERARHPRDLVDEDATLLFLDHRVAGVGSEACGPGVREDLRVRVEEDEFEFVLHPVGL